MNGICTVAQSAGIRRWKTNDIYNLRLLPTANRAFEMRYTFKLKDDNKEIEVFSGVFCEDCKERIKLNQVMSESFLKDKVKGGQR